MKNYLILLFSIISIFGNTQIITEDAKKEETKPVEEEKAEVKIKSGTEIYFGVSPAYTYRTLEQNSGIFGQPLGHRENEIGHWTAGFNIGVRNELTEHLKLEFGVGYSTNKESFDYTETDSVFRYTNTYRHIAFPIRMAYTFGDDIAFYGGIGIIPKAFISMLHEETVLDFYKKEQTVKTVERDKFNMFLIDAVVTVGTQIKLSPNYGVFAMVEARRQLTNNFNSQSPFIRKPYALGFNVGLEIYL